MERSEIQFGQTAIPYTIHRGRRQKTVAVAVDPVEGVRVRAPADTSIERLDEIVHRKARWILDRRRRCEDLPPSPSPREFISGETFLYAGRQYRLKLVHADANGDAQVRLARGYLQVPQPGGPSDPLAVRGRLVHWYRARAAVRLPERTAVWSEKLGVEPSAVLVRDQRKRWGSADPKGVVRLNWRVVQAPTRLVDYVVAHELVHLRHRYHTREFWAELGRVMPNYEERRESLREIGRAMIW